MPISFQDATAPVQGPIKKGATQGPISFYEATGIAPEPSIGGFLKDPESWKEMGGRLLGAAGQVSDMATGILGGLAGVAPYWGVNTQALLLGEPKKIAAQAATMAAEDVLPIEITRPWSVVAKALGPEAQKFYHENPIGWINEKISEVISSGGKAAESFAGLPAEHVQQLASQTMSSLGWAAARNSLAKSIAARKTTIKQLPPVVPPTLESLTPKPEIPYAELPYRSEMPKEPLTPEEAVAASKQRIAEIKKAVKAESPVEKALRMKAQTIPEGPAVWKVGDAEHPVQVIGPLERGPDGQMYAPAVLEGGTRTYVPAAELTEAVAPKGITPETSAAVVSTKTRLPEATVLGEETALVTGLAKVKEGKSFDLTALEKLAVERSKQASGRIVDTSGKPFSAQLGKADPKLLAAIAAAGGLAAYVAANPDQLGNLTAAGLLGVGMMKGGKPLAALFEKLPETSLIQAAREGNATAFTELYNREFPRLQRSVKSFEKSGLESEDIAQRTLEKFFKALQRPADVPGGFRGDAQVSTWLYRAAQNEAKKQLAAKSVRPQTVSLETETGEGSTIADTLGHTETPQKIFENTALAGRLTDALEKVDPTFREAFEMRELEGMSYEAIAEAQGVPVGTVRSRIFRAKEQLQKSLKDYQRGNADKKLLVGIGAATAGGLAANALLDSDVTLGELGVAGLLTVGTVTSRSALGSILKGEKYTFKTLERLPQNRIKFMKGQIEQELRRADIAKAEKDVVQRVLDATEGDSIAATELVKGVKLATNDHVLIPEKTTKEATYGVWHVSDSPETAFTTLYKAPFEINTPSLQKHFHDPRVFGWTRSFIQDRIQHVVEVQSDFAQARTAYTRQQQIEVQDAIKAKDIEYAKLQEELDGIYTQAATPLDVNTKRLFEIAQKQAEIWGQTETLRARLKFSPEAPRVIPLLKHWPRRLIQEELAQAGGKPVRFATADTVAKVEGWQRARETGGERFQSLGHQSIYNRYAGEITTYLKGLGGREVLDAQGNSWIEVPGKAGRVNMYGRADPALLVGMGAMTVGAVLGAITDPEHPLRNSLYGALAGGLLGTAKGRAALQEATAKPDKYLGLISTRIGLISPRLKFALRRHEYRTFKALKQANDAVLPFLTALGKLPKESLAVVERALLNGDLATVMKVPELRTAYPRVQKLLGELEGQLKELNRFGEGVVNYFPRLVRDFEGLKKALGQKATQGLDLTLAKAEAAMLRKKRRALTDVEESLIVNRYLSGPDTTSFLPSFAKGRKIGEVPEALQQFYEPATESLLRYVTGAIRDIEKAKFFGKDLVVAKKGGKSFTDLDSSIGALTSRLRTEGKITSKQALELRDMLKARFEGGEKGMGQGFAFVRNITNAGLLGNFAAASTQIADSLLTIRHYGLTPTLQALAEKLIGKERITPEQLGIINHVAEELSELGYSGRVLHESLKWSGFKVIDMFAKDLSLNAARIKNAKLVATKRGRAEFRAKYQDAFGDKTEQVIRDLQQRKMTPEIEELTFTELSDIQPISKAELPEAYLAHPNERILYQLKTFMLKQADIVRREAYHNIKTGEPKLIAKGVKNLASLAAAYAISNVPGDVIKNWLAGRDEDVLSTPKLVENVLQTFGINRYTQERLGQGKLVDTGVQMITPPLKVIEDVGLGKPKAVSYIPLVGRPLYERKFGGNERREIYENRLAGKGKGKPLSPAAKKYLRQKRLEAKKREMEARRK